MQENPRIESFNLVSVMCKPIFLTVSIKPEEVNFNPKRPLICDTAMITDVAEVKPTVTGMDIKSIRTPGKKNKKKQNY